MNTLTPINPTTSPTTGAGNSPNAVNERREPALQPPVDVFEDPTGITLYADLPGVPRENLRLLVDGDRLTIAAEMKLAPVEGLTASHAEVSLSRMYLGEDQLCDALDRCLDVSRYLLSNANGWLGEEN